MSKWEDIKLFSALNYVLGQYDGQMVSKGGSDIREITVIYPWKGVSGRGR